MSSCTILGQVRVPSRVPVYPQSLSSQVLRLAPRALLPRARFVVNSEKGQLYNSNQALLLPSRLKPHSSFAFCPPALLWSFLHVHQGGLRFRCSGEGEGWGRSPTKQRCGRNTCCKILNLCSRNAHFLNYYKIYVPKMILYQTNDQYVAYLGFQKGGGANFRWPLVLTQRGRPNYVSNFFPIVKKNFIAKGGP